MSCTLEIIVDRMMREFKVECQYWCATGGLSRNNNQALCEVITLIKNKVVVLANTRGIELEFEPLEPGEGYQFVSKVVGGSVPKEYIPGVEKGLKSARESWHVIAGFPVIDFRVTLVDGASHDVDSSVMAFEIAARVRHFGKPFRGQRRNCLSRS